MAILCRVNFWQTVMTELLGDYQDYVARAEAGIAAQGIAPSELAQADMLNIECSTDERYERVKAELRKAAELLSEIEHNGRLISIFEMNEALTAGAWAIPHVELLAPKPTRENNDGIDGMFFVTTTRLAKFLKVHKDIRFEEKGLNNDANPYVELKGDEWAVKFHDRHMGAVLDIEQRFTPVPAEAPNYGGHVTL